jgi:acetyl-CoA C-acetyltransferase
VRINQFPTEKFQRGEDMPEAFIVSAVRSAVGRRNGGLSQMHPADLSAEIMKEAVARAGVDPAAVDDVYWGCVDQVGAQAFNVGRTSWLVAGLPERVPATTIDRQCGSSQQAVHFAAQSVMSGVCDLVLAGGVEVMSLVPLMSSTKAGEELGYGTAMGSPGWIARYGEVEVNQFVGAERIAGQWQITRLEMEEFAIYSHARAAAAQDRGAFTDEILTIGDCAVDEGIRRDSSLERLAALQPLRPGGTITAGVASQISDGSAALMLASESAVMSHGLKPLARVHAMLVEGSDPVLMLTGPIPATQGVLKRGGLGIGDIDRFEVNEAFASVVLAWAKELDAPPERTNVNGGAIALGHPLGATGARLMTSLVHELRSTSSRYGLQTMCEGGGMANAMILEAL